MASAIPFFREKALADHGPRGLKKCSAWKRALFSVQLLIIHRNPAVDTFKFPDAILREVFQLRVQRPLVVPGNICDFVKKLRVKPDTGLDFVGCHDNTPLLIYCYFSGFHME